MLWPKLQSPKIGHLNFHVHIVHIASRNFSGIPHRPRPYMPKYAEFLASFELHSIKKLLGEEPNGRGPGFILAHF